MNLALYLALVAYLIGAGGSLIYAAAEFSCGYRVAGRTIFWPLFLIKAAIVTVWVTLLDLFDGAIS